MSFEKKTTNLLRKEEDLSDFENLDSLLFDLNKENNNNNLTNPSENLETILPTVIESHSLKSSTSSPIEQICPQTSTNIETEDKDNNNNNNNNNDSKNNLTINLSPNPPKEEEKLSQEGGAYSEDQTINQEISEDPINNNIDSSLELVKEPQQKTVLLTENQNKELNESSSINEERNQNKELNEERNQNKELNESSSINEEKNQNKELNESSSTNEERNQNKELNESSSTNEENIELILNENKTSFEIISNESTLADENIILKEEIKTNKTENKTEKISVSTITLTSEKEKSSYRHLSASHEEPLMEKKGRLSPPPLPVKKKNPPPLPPKKNDLSLSLDDSTRDQLEQQKIDNTSALELRSTVEKNNNDNNKKKNENIISSPLGSGIFRKRGQGFSYQNSSQTLKQIIQDCLDYTGELPNPKTRLPEQSLLGKEGSKKKKSQLNLTTAQSGNLGIRFSHSGITTTPKRAIEIHRFFSLFLNQNHKYGLGLTCLIKGEDYDRVSSALVDFYSQFDPPQLLSMIKYLIQHEINSLVNPTTLFRGSTMGIKIIIAYTKLIGGEWIIRALQSTMIEICKNTPDNFEVDPEKIQVGNKSLDQKQCQQISQTNFRNLNESCEKVLNHIYESANIFPRDLQLVFKTIFQIVESKFPQVGVRAIASIFFLRMISPALISPEIFMRVPERYIKPPSRRKLLLIAKVLQNTANGIEFNSKEGFMNQTNQVVTRNKQILFEYMVSLATTTKEELETVLIPTTKSIESLNTIYELTFNNIKEIETSCKNFIGHKTSKELVPTLAVIAEPPMFKITKKKKEVNIYEDETTTPLYKQYLEKAHDEDFSDIISTGAIYLGGLDPQDRPTVVVIVDKISKKGLNWDNLFLYILILLDPIVQNNYSIAYIHSALTSENTPTFSWLKTAYQVLTRKYKKNLKHVYVVQASSWLKITATAFRPFVSTKFWSKVHWLDDVKELLTYFKNGLILPEELKK